MICASWLVQLCLFLHIIYQPYDKITEFGNLCNKLEIMSLASLVITLNSGIVFGTTQDNYPLGIFESSLSIIVMIINMTICIIFAYHIFITGSDKSRKSIKSLCSSLIENNRLNCVKLYCNHSFNQLKKWSERNINITNNLIE